MTEGLKAFLENMTEAQKHNFNILLENAEREQERFTVPLQSSYNTDEKSLEAIAYINNQFFEKKFKSLVRSFFDIFPELETIDGAKDGIEEILKRKVGIPIGQAGALTTEEPNKQNRTRTRAGEDVLRKLPDRAAFPTLKGYRSATSLFEDGNAYLKNLKNMDSLQFKKNKLFFNDNGTLQQMSEVELKDFQTKDGIENINLPFLQFYYSILFSSYEQAFRTRSTIPKVTKIYFPDLAEKRGLGRNISKSNIETIINDVKSFHNVVGVLHITRNGKPDESYFPVLNFEGYDAETNTFSLSSPYLTHVIDTIYKAAARKTETGKLIKKTTGELTTQAFNTYIVKQEIQKERSKTAVFNVFLICQGIEAKGGKNGYEIAASTLIDRNQQLKHRLEIARNPRTTLTRCLKKTYELLHTMTDLEEKYINIKLPDPENPEDIPTMTTLDGFVIRIPHNGVNPNYKSKM